MSIILPDLNDSFTCPDSGFRIPDFPYALKTRLNQTYIDFERIAELNPSMSSLKRILEKKLPFRVLKANQ